MSILAQKSRIKHLVLRSEAHEESVLGAGKSEEEARRPSAPLTIARV